MPLNDFRSVHLPYCLQRQPDGRHVVLNREYKPLGFNSNAHVNYEDYPILFKMERFTEAVAMRVSCNGSRDRNQVLLYNDGCFPTSSAKNMKAYLERLAILAKLRLAPS